MFYTDSAIVFSTTKQSLINALLKPSAQFYRKCAEGLDMVLTGLLYGDNTLNKKDCGVLVSLLNFIAIPYIGKAV